MNRVHRKKEIVLSVTMAIITFYILVLASVWANATQTRLTQGTPVTILSNSTIVTNGQICQEVEKANISYTGENGPDWRRMRVVAMLFPATDYYVVKLDGTQLWINNNHLEVYDPEKSFCSPVVQ